MVDHFLVCPEGFFHVQWYKVHKGKDQVIMDVREHSRSEDFYRQLPKVELHRHLEGSLRVRTMMEIVRAHDIDVKDTGILRPLVQMEREDEYTFENFLAKFGTLRLFYKSPHIIRRITREAIQDAAEDHVRYLELRFTPVALSHAEDFPIDQVVEWVIDSTKAASEKYGIMVRLILSINRHESMAQAQEVAQLAVDRMEDGIVGLDLAGNESDFAAKPFQSLFKEVRKEGIKITIHAGEWGGAGNVREAIQSLHADRIGHGVRILEDPRVVDLARKKRMPFEVCVTSNYHSGVVDSIRQHPLSTMLEEGLNVTINTDDPSISRITLGHEYQTVTETFGLPIWLLRERVLAAVRASFLSPRERQRLGQEISTTFSKCMVADDAS